MTAFTFAHFATGSKKVRSGKGEEPPMTRSVGVMTDADNTGEKVHAFHGDIRFQRAALP